MLRLRQTPQGAGITSVETAYSTGGVFSTAVTTDYTLVGRQLIRNAQPWPEGYQTVRVIYPGFSSVPEDVKQAALDLLSVLYKGGRSIAAGVSGGNGQPQEEGQPQNVPFSVEAVKRKYVGIVPPGF